MDAIKPLPVRAARFIAALWWALTHPPALFAEHVRQGLPGAPTNGLDAVAMRATTGARWVGESAFVIDDVEALMAVVYWYAEPHEQPTPSMLFAELCYWGFAQERVGGVARWEHRALMRSNLAASCCMRPPPIGHLAHIHTPPARLAP